MRTLKAGILYFVLVFGAGFILGPIRVLWLVPRVGVRAAELMEAPIMIAVTILAARWVVRQFEVPAALSARLGVGLLAFGLLIASEVSMVGWLWGMTIRQYLANQDPVSGTVFYLLIAIFGVMPAFVARR
ncbi:MAG TPA: hypothetical protein VL197_13410 [Nitrospirota bacterium]|nr:hypothetical protein [Nitrospirota bacterium]